jgi:hypothetical protein
MRSTTTIQPDEKEDWPFFCERCKRGFYSTQGLSRHNRTVHNPDCPKFGEEARDRALRLADRLRRDRKAMGLTTRGTIPKKRRKRSKPSAQPSLPKTHSTGRMLSFQRFAAKLICQLWLELGNVARDNEHID